MKTTELLEYLIPNAEEEMSGKQYANAINAIHRCIREAIKTDRENLLNHIHYILVDGKQEVNRHLLLNAPNIELL